MDGLYDEGVVASDTLSFVEIVDASGQVIQVKLEGEVVCTSGVRVRVLEWLIAERRKQNRLHVQTTFYQYHAWRPRAPGRLPEQSILRFDQAHGSDLHRHYFDAAGNEVRSETISPDAMPRLSDVIREAHTIGSESAGG